MTSSEDDDLAQRLANDMKASVRTVKPSADGRAKIDRHIGRRARRRRNRRVGLVVVAAVAFVGALVGVVTLRTDDSVKVAIQPLPQPSVLYSGIGTLLLAPGKPLMLCGSVLESGPPQCGNGVPINGVDPSTLPSMMTLSNVTYSQQSFRLTGTWDGTTLAVTEPAVPFDPTTQPPRPPPVFPMPCPEPSGGWPPLPFADATAYIDALHALDEYGDSHPDTYVGKWSGDNAQSVLVMAFTDDPELHRPNLEAIYPRVCVTKRDVSKRSLEEIQAQVQQQQLTNGNYVTSVGIDPVSDAVIVSLLILDDETRSSFAVQYGDAVQIEGGFLQPI